MPVITRAAVVPLIVACALFMQNLDSTIIATALPAMAASLAEEPLRLNLAITSYLLSLAIFIPLSGWTADRFGARTVFRWAILVFTLGSLACGAAQHLPELVLARTVQGMGGAMMVPVGRLVMLRTVPKSDLVRAMSWLAVPALIGPVIGPPLGGLIVTYGSWRWIFFLNLPIGLLGFILVGRFFEDIREPQAWPLDVPGFLLAALGLASLMYGFETVGRGVLPGAAVAALLIAGAVLLALYAFHARYAAFPIIDLALLRVQTFRAAALGSALFRIGVDGLPFLMPMLLQVGFGLSPLGSGLLTFATSAGAMTMKMTATPIIRAFGFRWVLIGNAAITGVFMMSYALLRPSTPHLVILAALLAGGFFRSLQVTSTNTLVYADVPAAQMSRATSFASMMQQLTMGMGVGASALLLHLALTLRGGSGLVFGDFAMVFVLNGVIAAAAMAFFIPLPAHAGAELSGHRTGELKVARKET